MDKNINLEIGERIRKIRTGMGLSREELSEMIGISALFLGFIECGQRGMSISTLMSLSRILNVSTDYILTGKITSDPKQELIDTVNSIDEKYIPMAIENLNYFKRLISLIQSKNDEK